MDRREPAGREHDTVLGRAGGEAGSACAARRLARGWEGCGCEQARLVDMEPAERAAYCEEQKCASQMDKIVCTGYHTLQLVHFYTAGAPPRPEGVASPGGHPPVTWRRTRPVQAPTRSSAGRSARGGRRLRRRGPSTRTLSAVSSRPAPRDTHATPDTRRRHRRPPDEDCTRERAAVDPVSSPPSPALTRPPTPTRPPTLPPPTPPQAEVYNYDDWKAQLKETDDGRAGPLAETAVKETGKYRQEGKNYVVKDGDVIFFKFNVTTDKKK